MNKKSILFIGTPLLSSRDSLNINISISEEIAQRLAYNGWKTILTSPNNNKILRLFDRIWVIVSQHKNFSVAEIDVFSGPAFFWALICAEVLRVFRKPIILTLHGGNLPQFALSHPRLVRRILNNAKHVVAPSNYLIDNLANFHRKIILIPNGLELKNYPNRIRYGSQTTLVWIRAFHSIYNPSLAIASLNILIKQGISLNMVMVGPDKGDGSLHETYNLINDYHLENNIKIIPGVDKDHIPGILDQGDIFINTTNIDNTPVSVIEAMACGLCIVSTNVGGIPFLLTDNVEGLLVPPNDPGAMAASIKRILKDPILAGNLSSNSRKKVENFDWSVILPQWESLFES